MAEEYEQFYRTWCYSGRSVSGADGWKVRGKSDGLALQEAEGLADLANYWSPTEFQREAPPGRRLALFRRLGDSVVAHGAPVAGLVGGRGGVSFEHVVVGLPASISALEVVKLWRSSAWRVEDGSFSARLERFVWNEAACGPEFQSSEAVRGGIAGEREGAVALDLLGQGEVISWASYVLRACLAVTGGAVDKVFVAGKDDTIARLLFVALYCLPERLRARLTFSTHENPRATKGVQFVGVTTLEGGEPDLPRFCYDGRYCAFNTFSGNKSEELRASVFAESAIQWILYGQYELLERVRAGFDALDPTDNPGVEELDLLAEHLPTEGDDEGGAAGLLRLCGRPAIGHSTIRDRNGLEGLLRHAERDSGYEEAIVAQLGTWLPKHEAASAELPAGLAEAAFERLREGQAFERVAWLGRFAGRVGQGLELRYWEELMTKCRRGACGGRPGGTGIPALETRMELLRTWHQGHQLSVQGDGAALDELVGCWLRVQPQELGTVLNSDLAEGLKREAVRLWVQMGTSEEFRKVIGEARRKAGLQERLVAQLAGLARERGDVVGRLPGVLAGVGLVDLRGGCGFTEVEWLGRLAGGVGAAIEGQFWEELLLACQGAVGQAGGGGGFLPAMETRISLFERWEKVVRSRERGSAGVLAGAWLRVTPAELEGVLKSGMSPGLKVEGLRLCLSRATGMDTREAEAVFGLVCKDVEVSRLTVSELPRWQDGAAVGRVPEASLAMLLGCWAERMRLADFLDESLLDTAGFWCARVPKAVPVRMRALLSFGAYARNPGGFRQATGLAPELMKPDLWGRERERDAAVNGAVDRLLSRGDLGDFERALDWFGEKKWTSSGWELIRLAEGRVSAKSARCRDAELESVLSVLACVLKEWEEARQGNVAARPDGSDLGGMGGKCIGALCRIAMRHLPGSSLLKSPTGHQVIEHLDANTQVLDPVQRGWVQKLHSLLEVCTATEFLSEMIETLARSYVALDKEGDADMRIEVNALLLKLVSKKPKALGLALVAFVNNVYAKNETLFLRGFMPGFVEELVRLERQTESGAVAEVFISFCLEGCFLEQGGNFADRRSSEMAGWLGQFKRGSTTKSIGRVNGIAQAWDSRTRERWYRESGYKPKWFETPSGKRALKYSLAVVLVGTVAVAVGLGGWSRYQEWALLREGPRISGKELGVWLAQSDEKGPAPGLLLTHGPTQDFGTNCIPALLRMAGKKDSALGRISVKLLRLTEEREWHRRAEIGFQLLGERGKGAVEELKKLEKDKDGEVKRCAGVCLRSIEGVTQEGGKQ